MAEEKRTPLKDSPLRLPGQSLDERFQSIVDDRVMLYIFAPCLIIFYAIMQWASWFSGAPPHPVLWTVIACGVVLFSIWRIKKLIPELRQLRRGSKGEKVVGQLLEQFRADGFKVFHDIPGSGFNIDHVIVGPQGAFTIETKTISKPPRGLVEVVFDGEKITING